MSQESDPKSGVERVDLQSLDVAEQKRHELLRLFPEVRTEGDKIDFDRLKLTLGAAVDIGKERYALTWPGKAECFRTIQRPSTAALRPMVEDSVDFDTTENLIIQGDNLEVLKLLQKAYLGKVKVIYIDPPYNTGNDFIYPDNYTESLQTYLEYTGQVDAQGKKFSTNTEVDGRFHSKWLNMMYPRLYFARNLLHDQGLIVVQIGDTELPALRRIMDEIFGEENYVNTIAIKAKVAAGASGGGEDKRLKKNVEFALIYTRAIDSIEGFAQSFVEEPLLDVIGSMREEGQSWKYTSVLLDEGTKRHLTTTTDGEGNAIEIYVHDNIVRSSVAELCKRDGFEEEAAYRKYFSKIFSDTNAQTSIRTRVIDAAGSLREAQMYSVEYVPRSGRDRGKLVRHYYVSPSVRRVIWLSEVAYDKEGRLIKRERTGTLWDDISYNNIGKEGGVPFPNGKKPVELLRRVIRLSSGSDDLVLDFFAGSGTTGHAVLAQNYDDGGARRFILVQLPEQIEESSDTVAGLTVRRMTNVSREYLSRFAETLRPEGAPPHDVGFRVLKLAESNILSWGGTTAAQTTDVEQQLSLHVHHLRAGRTDEDLLFEILLREGFPPTTRFDKVKVSTLEAHGVADGALIICLSRKLDLEGIRAIAAREPQRVVCLDEGFAGNDQLKTNAAQIFKAKGIVFRTV